MGIPDVSLAFGGRNIVKRRSVAQHLDLGPFGKLAQGVEGSRRPGVHDRVILADISRVRAGFRQVLGLYVRRIPGGQEAHLGPAALIVSQDGYGKIPPVAVHDGGRVGRLYARLQPGGIHPVAGQRRADRQHCDKNNKKENKSSFLHVDHSMNIFSLTTL